MDFLTPQVQKQRTEPMCCDHHFLTNFIHLVFFNHVLLHLISMISDTVSGQLSISK